MIALNIFAQTSTEFTHYEVLNLSLTIVTDDENACYAEVSTGIQEIIRTFK